VQKETYPDLEFYGGLAGALAPFLLFMVGVAWLGLSGAPDERGLWPMLLAAITLGLLLVTNRKSYCEAVLQGMSHPIVILMIMAWLLAGVLGTLMNATGLIEALVWIAHQAGVSGGGYVAAAFLICCTVSTTTGTSIGTVLLCGPLLYPAGGALGANPAILMGAILGGATFGDNISPISDTTIASALTQQADMGGVVRSRLKYALPAAGIALVLFAALGGVDRPPPLPGHMVEGSPRGLPSLLAPILVIGLLLAGHHLLECLLFGILACTSIGLVFGLVNPEQLLYIEPSSFQAQGVFLEGFERGIGVSIFTLLLMGLVSALRASGILDLLVASVRRKVTTARAAELWIFGTVSAAVVLTTHSVVAMLTVGDFARETGQRFGINSYRRANILDITVCTYPFLFPYFIPVILAASASATGIDVGMPRLSPFVTGLYNFHSWLLLAVVLFAILTGYGRNENCATRSPDEAQG
jgi:Na+/H+ antiporter NhaC